MFTPVRKQELEGQVYLTEAATLTRMASAALQRDSRDADGRVVSMGLVGFIQEHLSSALRRDIEEGTLIFNSHASSKTDQKVLDLDLKTLKTVMSPAAIHLVRFYDLPEDTWAAQSALTTSLLQLRGSAAAAINLINTWDWKAHQKFQNDPTQLLTFLNTYFDSQAAALWPFATRELTARLLSARTAEFRQSVLIIDNFLPSATKWLVEKVDNLDMEVDAWTGLFGQLTVTAIMSLIVNPEQLQEMFPESANISTAFAVKERMKALARLQQLCSAILYAPLVAYITLMKTQITQYERMTGISIKTAAWAEFEMRYEADLKEFVPQFIPSFLPRVLSVLEDSSGLLPKGIYSDVVPDNFLKKMMRTHRLGRASLKQKAVMEMRQFEDVTKFHSKSTIPGSTMLAHALRRMPLMLNPMREDPHLTRINSDVVPQLLVRFTYAAARYKVHNPIDDLLTETRYDLFNVLTVHPHSLSSTVTVLTRGVIEGAKRPIAGCLPANPLYRHTEEMLRVVMDWDHDLFTMILNLSKESRLGFIARSYIERFPGEKEEAQKFSSFNLPGMINAAGYLTNWVVNVTKAAQIKNSLLPRITWSAMGPVQLSQEPGTITPSDVEERPELFIRQVTKFALADILAALSSPGSSEFLATHMAGTGVFVIVDDRLSETAIDGGGSKVINPGQYIYVIKGLGHPFGLEYADLIKLTCVYTPGLTPDTAPVMAILDAFNDLTSLGTATVPFEGQVYFLPYRWMPSADSKETVKTLLSGLTTITTSRGQLRHLVPVPAFSTTVDCAHLALEWFDFAPETLDIPELLISEGGGWESDRYLIKDSATPPFRNATYTPIFSVTNKWTGQRALNGLTRTTMPFIYGEKLTQASATPEAKEKVDDAILSQQELEQQAEAARVELSREQQEKFTKEAEETAQDEMATAMTKEAQDLADRGGREQDDDKSKKKRKKKQKKQKGKIEESKGEPVDADEDDEKGSDR